MPDIDPIAAQMCGLMTQVQDLEHANRLTGGFGCGRETCPPPSRLDTLMGGGA